MPIAPNFLERLLFLNLNEGPAPVLDIFGAVAFRTLVTAIRLNVFDKLSKSPTSAAELAHEINADERGILVLLETLAPLGYVEERAGLYANTAMAKKWLVSSSPTSIAAGFRYWDTTLSELWDDLENSIREGKPSRNLYEWIENRPNTSRDFQTWMIALARLTADEIVSKIALSANARRLLDVGGGHATYSIEMCRRHVKLSATVIDSPQALDTARDNVASAGMGGRITLRAGDFMRDTLDNNYDIALLFNVVHGFTPEQNGELVHKIATALNAGGTIVIAEQMADRASGPASQAINAILRLSYFHLIEGRIYAFAQIAQWLTNAGFVRIRRVNLLKAPGTSLVLGTAR